MPKLVEATFLIERVASQQITARVMSGYRQDVAGRQHGMRSGVNECRAAGSTAVQTL